MLDLLKTRDANALLDPRSRIATRLTAGSLAGALLLAAATVMAADSGGTHADGDSCTIDRDGLKIPGTVKGLECCSVLKADDCVVILKPFPGNTPAAKPIPTTPIPARPISPTVKVPPAGTAGTARP